MEVYEQLLRLQKEGRPYALATVIRTQGRTPRSPGTKMLVSGDGSLTGTIGGGDMERQAIADCREAMTTGAPVLKEYTAVTGAESSTVTVFIEPGKPRPCLYLCGCGHVAQAVLPLAKSLGYYVVCIDARDISGFGDALAPADELHILEDFRQLEDLSFRPGAAVIACSFSHESDGEILKAVLKKEPAFVGMLGGRHKIRMLFRMLRDCGVADEVLDQIHAPIGLDLGGEMPAEIAVAIMAELLAAREGGTCRPMAELIGKPWKD